MQKEKEKEKDEQFENQSECEDFEDYGPQGYHPVYLGQRFNNGSYQVIQKVGWGHFSTVWLVQSLTKTNQYYALKVQKSKDTHAQTAVDQLNLLKILMAQQQNPEWQVQLKSKFNLSFPQTIDMSQIYRPLLLIDNFVHFGMHGKHYCSVFELMGPNLLDLIQHYQYKDAKMPLWLVKKITIDVLVGMVYMHEYAKMIHTDIKPQNIMVKLPDDQLKSMVQNIKNYKKKPLSMKYLNKLQSKNSDKNKKKYQKKKLKKKAAKQAVNGEQGAEKQVETKNDQTKGTQQTNTSQATVSKNVVQTTNMDIQTSSIAQSSQVVPNSQQASEPISEPVSQPVQQKQLAEQQKLLFLEWKKLHISIDDKLHFKIADFGNATLIDKHFTQQIQTRQYRSPQVIVGSQYNETADIWSLACMVYQMLTNSFLFKPKDRGDITKDQDHLYKMIELLGSMPKLISSEGTQSRKYFNKKGDLIHGNPQQPLSITQLLHQDYDYSIEDAQEAQIFLEPMLKYDPKKRISARQCLKSKWLWS